MLWWPGTELNRRRQPFQGCALPPELPGHAAPLHGLDACELWATPDLPELPAVKNAGVLGTATIITTKLDSLNETARG
jgi:hypothetical protein